MRYLTGALENDLREKMVMLSGPRQTGKTWLARYLCQSKGVYLNWDVRKDQRIIREIAWPKTSSLVVLEELHKYRKWKNFLKKFRLNRLKLILNLTDQYPLTKLIRSKKKI